MNVKKSFFYSRVISSSVLSWPLVSVFLCVSTCQTRPSDSSQKSLDSHSIFCVLCFCVSLCARPDHQIVPKSHQTAILYSVFCVSLCARPDNQIVPKSHWTAINTWRNPRNRPTPICQLQIRYSLSGKYDTQYDTVGLGRNSGPNGMKDGVRQGQGHGCKSQK